MRKVVLNNFNQIFDLSTGFCTAKHWNQAIETNCFVLCNDSFTTTYSDEKFVNYNFDFEEQNFALLKSFRHFSLFSICLHFLRCVRSCDKKSDHYILCSRVCGGYIFESNLFSCLRIGKAGSYLGFYGDLRIDLNVFCMLLYILWRLQTVKSVLFLTSLNLHLICLWHFLHFLLDCI